MITFFFCRLLSYRQFVTASEQCKHEGNMNVFQRGRFVDNIPLAKRESACSSPRIYYFLAGYLSKFKG